MKIPISAIALVFVSLNAFGEVPLRIGPRKDVSISQVGKGAFEVEVSGVSPHFWTEPVPQQFDPSTHSVISFEYFSPSGVESMSVRFRQSDGSMVLAGSSPVPLAETWQPFSIDLSENGVLPPKGDPKLRFHLSMKYRPDTVFQIRNFKLRSPDASERKTAEEREQIQKRREADGKRYLDYLRDWYPNSISSVGVMEDSVVVKGQASEPLSLLELPPQMPSHATEGGNYVAVDIVGEFELSFARYTSKGKRDRALSRWRLDRPNRSIASLCKWPGAIGEGIPADLPKLTAPHVKGLGGIPNIAKPDHEIFELGIRHATVNVVLDAAISRNPKKGWKPFQFEGKTYFANAVFLNQKITTVRRLCEKEVLVTCILLVSNSGASQLKHPEAEARGTFAMPDLATAEGTAHYRAALSLLADRFSKPEHRVSNWVIHNEIDQAGTWTNMGDQPLARYLETYIRSSRIVYQTMRLRDPHARVFISLTHHWTKPSLGKGAYTVRELLELWNEANRAEGDYEWGVAYHPYPQNLRDPDTWDDQDVSWDFDTPYITPKNMEVLPAYLKQERFLYKGKKERAILFSEQGFNSPTLSEEDQRRQAAGLIYTFRKLPNMPTVEAYHLHRYQDMPDREGGLRLGIIDEHGNRKLGWEVYAAIGSETESSYDYIAEEIIPEDTATGEVGEPKRPNIVLMMADDLGWSDTTPYQTDDEDFYETPSIAALAQRGMRFTRAYAASPLCSPTRASVLTGQYPGRIRLTTPACHLPNVVLNPKVPATASAEKFVVEPETRTRFPNHYVILPEQLGKVGYSNAFVGKWHLGRAPYFPDQQGFDLVVGGREHPGPPGGFFAPWPIDTIPDAPEGSHIDDVITTEAIRWVEDRKNAEKPFFLNLWFYSVHAPFQAKPDLIEKYRKKAETLPDDAPRRNPVMGAMIETLDDNVGRIMQALDRLGIAEDTIVVFTSDNGGNEYNFTAGKLATNNYPLRAGKGNIADGGQRVPFIAAWPGRIEENSTNDGLVSTVDIFPTLLAVANVPAASSQEVDGENILPVLTGDVEIKPEREIFCHFPHSPSATGTIAATSVHRGPWKLTRFFGDSVDQSDRLHLVNLKEDPAESRDLSKEKPELAAELNQAISANLAETSSLVPVKNPNYEPSFLGWKGGEQSEVARSGGELSVFSNGNDPQICTSRFSKAVGILTVEIEMKQSKDSPVDLYWATGKGKGFSKERSITMDEVAPGVWRGNVETGTERLSALRIDPMQTSGTALIDTIRLIEWKEPGEGKSVRLWDF